MSESIHPLAPEILTLFREADLDGSGHEEQAFFGPVNALLTRYFPLDQGFVVSPRPVPIGCVDEAFDFTIEFDVCKSGHLCLIVLVKPKNTLRSIVSRETADKQMRARFRSIADREKLNPTIYGLIFFGAKVAYYTLDTVTLRWTPPTPGNPDPNKIHSEPDINLWNDSILNAVDAERIVALMRKIAGAEQDTKDTDQYIVFSSYYKHGDTEILCFEDERALRGMLYEEFKKYNDRWACHNMLAMPLDEACDFVVRDGLTHIKDQEGWGVVGVAKGRLIKGEGI